MSNVIYKGPVNIYLEGKNALWPISKFTLNNASYRVGSREVPITIQDYRTEATRAAIAIINSNKDDSSFTDSFNKSALVEIIENNNELKIKLLDCPEKIDNPILWLGIIHDGIMPVQHVLWQILQPVGEKSVAFIALVQS